MPTVTVPSGKAALEALAEEPERVVLLDLGLPDMHGFEVLERARASAHPAIFIVVTATDSVDTALDAVQHGASDYLVKPVTAERLRVTARNALDKLRMRRRVERLEATLTRDRYHGFVGASPAMQAVYRLIETAASSKASVLITGETGTGKELAAQAMHDAGVRAGKPFVPLNCAAIPSTLIESELFGHAKGAFTGASTDREGAAQAAHKGTLFLDEIGELHQDLQARLLRFLQTGEVQPVGSTRRRRVDVRIICATNRDPLAEVQAGRFREDLYYRLHVIPIHLPPLRERGDDVLLLARHFLQTHAASEGRSPPQLSLAAAERIRAYPWPGNVRELQNVLQRTVVLNSGSTIEAGMLSLPVSVPRAASTQRLSAPHETSIRPLWQVEREAIEAAIAECDGNIPRAAVLLEVNPSTLYRKKALWARGG